MQPPPLVNNIPCCIIMDSSALLSDQEDMVELLRKLLPASPHVIVVPQDVLVELRGLTSSTSGATASQAESVLKALKMYPDFAPRATSATSKASTAAPRQRGVAVLQQSKETFYPLTKFARNRDTKIVACAHYFTVGEKECAEAGNAQQSTARRLKYRKAFFVTNDIVQHIKASPYQIPTIDTADLKNHWGHLGHWDL